METNASRHSMHKLYVILKQLNAHMNDCTSEKLYRFFDIAALIHK